jgi:mitochondrial chaperone BCS1
MDDCLKEYLARSESKTAIFEHEKEHWIRKASRNTRPLSTVLMKESLKNSLVDDVKDFLKLHTRLWYS